MKTRQERKLAREQEKKIMRQIAEEEKRIEAELPEDKFTINELFSILKSKSEEDIEYESYLTEEELIEEQKRKKDEKRIITLGATIMIFAAISVTILVNIYYNANKSDLLKVTEPLFKEYYKNKYGTKLKTKSIEELTIRNDKEIKNTGIFLLTTKENKHLMCIDNELIGDDINTTHITNDILEYIASNLGDIGLITHTSEISYQDYYTKYNRFLEYINVIPNDMTKDELIASGKLTVTYKLIYQGNIDDNVLLNTINKFSSDSAFYLIKMEAGLPINLKIVTNNQVINLDVENRTQKDLDITYLELDRTKNNVTNVEITKYTDNAVSSTGEYTLTKPLMIDFETDRRNEENTAYYFLQVGSGLISLNRTVELGSYKRDDRYQELEKEDYEDLVIIEYANYSYIIGTEKVFLAQKSSKKSFLCNLGIC